MTERIDLALSADSALVLFALLARVNDDQAIDFADQAEQRVLWDLEAALESSVAAVLAGDYDARLRLARDRVRDDE